MNLFRSILVAVVALALAGYAVDCTPMASADEAMQCCGTMPCDSHSAGHSQDCWQTMPSMHAPFLKAPCVHGISFSACFVLKLSASPQRRRVGCSGSAITRRRVA